MDIVWGFMLSIILGLVIVVCQEIRSGKAAKEAQDDFEEELDDDGSYTQNYVTAKRQNSHHCDGNCANCPPHYGYRYGRWYYGHGHQYGCERGGNGGASGKTDRD